MISRRFTRLAAGFAIPLINTHPRRDSTLKEEIKAEKTLPSSRLKIAEAIRYNERGTGEHVNCQSVNYFGNLKKYLSQSKNKIKIDPKENCVLILVFL